MQLDINPNMFREAPGEELCLLVRRVVARVRQVVLERLLVCRDSC